MRYFLEKLSLLASTSCTDLDISHISGERNEISDRLSRWDSSEPIPFDFKETDRIRISLDDLWTGSKKPELIPSSMQLPWNLPT